MLLTWDVFWVQCIVWCVSSECSREAMQPACPPPDRPTPHPAPRHHLASLPRHHLFWCTATRLYAKLDLLLRYSSCRVTSLVSTSSFVFAWLFAFAEVCCFRLDVIELLWDELYFWYSCQIYLYHYIIIIILRVHRNNVKYKTYTERNICI